MTADLFSPWSGLLGRPSTTADENRALVVVRLRYPSADRCLRMKVAARFVGQLPAGASGGRPISSAKAGGQRAKIGQLVAAAEKGGTVGHCPAAGKLRPCRNAR